MTTPYTTGTITLTNGSAVVTGVGTAWQTALIAGGTIFVDASGNSLPILSVDSNTAITAAVKWRGATGTYAYAIVRDTAYGEQTVANAQALATYLQRLDNASLSSIASLAPAVDRLPYFTGNAAAALATFTAFARTLLDDVNGAAAYGTLGEIPNAQLPIRLRQSGGANVVTNADDAGDFGIAFCDATAANIPVAAAGMLFTLSVFSNSKAQYYFRVPDGRVWFRTQSTTWSAWKQCIFRDDILAAVSQSGGLPTGGIMDRGSNANGFYFRYANGVMICISPTISLAPDTAAGSLWVSADTPWNMPGTMMSGDFVVIYSAFTGQRWTSARPTSTTQCYVRQWSFAQGITPVGGVAVAIGRWF
ncbi:pyocin knob domain-containing protein [Ensifer sp. Root278]|uniref:pyocin knob domain-containing protein n=1 Tax=Ensifer sp. Root278 TaxID=1736509 RepID=UPI00070B02D0|nr:pyocin knob domain-containing protein [Ensifer sp. Root278]KRD56470.1 hypothetical protein ASE60_08395 [Ensifer sp. Root278]